MKKLNTPKSSSHFFRKRNIAIAFFLMGILVTVSMISAKGMILNKASETQHTGSPDDVNFYTIRRLKGFQNIQPVFSLGPLEESVKFQPFKNEMELLIDSLKKTGAVSDVSIYLRDFKRGTWISMNGEKKYHPASLMKVPLMLAVLKTAEANPGMLEQQLVYKKPTDKTLPYQHFKSPTITENKTYTIHELIYYCAANSDNKATQTLAANINFGTVSDLFENIGLTKPDMQNDSYLMGVKEYSTFMETIFNAGFLGPEFSEYAAEILGNCSFNEGFTKGMPAGTKIWHKFGEWTSPVRKEAELHESGVFFIDGKPYLLTVMTAGSDLDRLTSVLQKVAGTTFRKLKMEPMSLNKSSLKAKNIGC